MKFRIEYIFDRRRPVYLFARKLDQGEFSLSETPCLGGVPIKRSLSQPRAIAPNGTPDLAVFTFILATANDLSKLSVGQEVELD